MTRTSRTWGIGLLVVAVMLAVAGTAPAQQTLVGNWGPVTHEDQPERGGGPPMADWAGVPLSEEGRLHALSWDAGILTLPEHQCKPHPSTYGYRGIGGPRIGRIEDPNTFEVVAITMHIPWMEQRRTVWMDDRPHPPEWAAHTWQGFSTGHWEGNTLVVDTTHLKTGWARRNGVLLSDATTMREYFVRHGERLTHIYVINDPHNLAEPFVKSSGFLLQNGDNLNPYPCQSVEEVDRPRGLVPHYLPGENPYRTEFATKYHLPIEAAMGGPETALPEFIKQFDTSETSLPPLDGQELADLLGFGAN
jgi:hypothetical protein